jgi:hypothetical protein
MTSELGLALSPGARPSRAASYAFILASLLRLAHDSRDAADVVIAAAPALRGVWLHSLFEPLPSPATLAVPPEHFGALLARPCPPPPQPPCPP